MQSQNSFPAGTDLRAHKQVLPKFVGLIPPAFVVTSLNFSNSKVVTFHNNLSVNVKSGVLPQRTI